MAKINNRGIYGNISNPSLLDFLLGTKEEDGSTKSFPLQSIIQLINGVNGKNNIQYQFSDGSDPDIDYASSGTFFTNNNNTSLPNFTELIFNKENLQSIDLSLLFNKIAESNDIVIRIEHPENPNIFFNLKVISFVDNTEYFVFGVQPFKDFYLGSLENEKIYSLYFDLQVISEEEKADKIIKSGNINISGLTISILENDFQWRINQQDFLNTPELINFPIPPAADGFYRSDILVGTSNNDYQLIQGTPDNSASVEPQAPINTIRLAGISLFGAIIGQPTPTPTSDFMQKSERDSVILVGSGVINQLDLVDEKATIVFKGAITRLNTISYAQIPYKNKTIRLTNLQSTPVTIGHSVSGYGVDFVFADGQDYILLPNQTIEFSFDITYAPYAHHMLIGSKGITNWSELQGKPSTFPPSAHTHTVSQITDFPMFKTIENQSIVGAGNIDLNKSDVGLSNVDNTSDANKPISTATQTALNGKEPIIPTGTALQYIKGDKTLGTFPTIPMVDQTIINGSTNAVSGNAVFDGLENTISKISKGLISGDSTIAQYLGQNAVASYLVTPKDILEGNVITDISVPGNTIAQQKTAWLALSDKDTYDYIIVQIGLNDVGFTESNATVIARLQDYINTINIGKKATCKVIIGEMIPCRARWDFLFGTTNGAIAQLQWEAINESIRGEGVNAITGINGRVSNHVKMLKDEFGNLAGIYDTGDLIHETNDARSLIASQYRSVLNNFNFLKIAKSTFFDDYLKKGFRSSDTFSLPNSSAGIGFNAVKINNTLRFSENGTAFFINSDNTGRLKFSVSTNVNSSGYSSPVTFSDKLMISSVGVSVNNAQIVGAFNVKQGVDKNISILDGDLDATAVQLNAFNDAGSLNVPMEFKSSKFMFNNGRVLINKTDDDLTNKLQVAGTISASPATTANQVVVKSQLDAVAGVSGTYTSNGINLVGFNNAFYTIKFIKVGRIVTCHLNGTCNASGSSGAFTFDLPSGFPRFSSSTELVSPAIFQNSTNQIFNAYVKHENTTPNTQMNVVIPSGLSASQNHSFASSFAYYTN